MDLCERRRHYILISVTYDIPQNRLTVRARLDFHLRIYTSPSITLIFLLKSQRTSRRTVG